jgi:hypothetical protein
MVKQPTKAKSKPKNEVNYTKTIVFKCEPTFDERESIIRRAIICEKALYENKPFRCLVIEKTMEQVKIKFFVKKIIKNKE